MNLLSIDFDFWVPEKISNDWGHAETGFFVGPAWIFRAGTMFRKGLDPRKECSTLADNGVIPETFAKFLKDQKTTFGRKCFTFAESHSAAYGLVNKSKDVSIVHIDAHHDCGYSDEMLFDERRSRRSDDLEEAGCDNWILRLAEKDRLRNLHIIYPEWRLDEVAYGKDYTSTVKKRFAYWQEKFGINVKVTYGLPTFPVAQHFDQLFLCRSGAWVPPWLDLKYNFMLGTLMSMYRRKNAIQMFSPHYPIIREFNWKEAEATGESEKKALEMMARKQEVAVDDVIP